MALAWALAVALAGPAACSSRPLSPARLLPDLQPPQLWVEGTVGPRGSSWGLSRPGQDVVLLLASGPTGQARRVPHIFTAVGALCYIP